MSLYLTGDVHSKVCNRFSFKQHPELRTLTDEDFMIIAGDFGAIWDWTGNSKEDKYYLNFVNSKPWKTIVVLGNHECYPIYEQMPHVTPSFLYSGSMYQCEYMGKIYENIYIVDTIAILDIEDNHILCINGADSHDKQWRIEGKSWWPQEAINIDKCLDFMENHDKEHFDIIITHDAPAAINDWFSRDGYHHTSTPGQKYLEVLRKELDFDSWIHGHMHFDMDWPNTIDDRIYGIYEEILILEE